MAAKTPVASNGSKTTKPTAYILSIGDGSDTIAQLPAMAKVFSTLSVGYYATGKVVLNGVAYQVGCSIVEIGSKPKKA
jgi:hypothetical protein